MLTWDCMNIDTNRLRWGRGDEIIKKWRGFVEDRFVDGRLEDGGWSVPRAPVILHCLQDYLKSVVNLFIAYNILYAMHTFRNMA